MKHTEIESVPTVGAEDAVLLKSAALEQVTTVAGTTNRGNATQSGESRAWTAGGRVD